MVDDVSTDGTKRIIDEYADRYDNFVAIHLDQYSRGAGKPRNTGMEAASAPYIMFLDGDDRFRDDACEQLYNAIETYRSEVVCGRIEKIEEEDYVLLPIYSRLFPKEVINTTIENIPKFLITPPAVWSRIYRRNFLQENNIRFPEGIIAQDAVFAINVFLKAATISYIPVTVGRFRKGRSRGEPSITQIVTPNFIQDLSTARKIMIDLFHQSGTLDFFSTMYQESLKSFLLDIIAYYQQNGNGLDSVFRTVSWFFKLHSKVILVNTPEIEKLLIRLIAEERIKEFGEIVDLVKMVEDKKG